MYRTGEVLSLLHELISIQKEPDSYKRKFLACRMSAIENMGKYYMEAQSRLEENPEIFKTIMQYTGKYPAAFYLAILLNYEYKRSPGIILSEIRKVLNHGSTTKQLLNRLGIYDIPYSDDIVANELNEINSFIR